MLLSGDKNKPEVPKDYFSKLDKRVDETISEIEFFNPIDYPLLFGMKHEEGLIMPDHYFKNFEVKAQLGLRRTKRLIKILSIAAAVAVAVSIFALSNKDTDLEEHEYKAEEILEYLNAESEEIAEINDEMLEGLLSEGESIKYLDIEGDLLYDFLTEDTDQIDLVWFY